MTVGPPPGNTAELQRAFFGEALTAPPQPHDLGSLAAAIADVGFVRMKALSTLEADARTANGDDATPAPEDIRQNSALIHVVDARLQPSPRLYRLTSTILAAKANLDVAYATTFDVSATAASLGNQRTPSSRLRYYHNIDPATYDELLPTMVGLWRELGCTAIVSSKKPLKEALADPNAIKDIEDEGRFFETTMPLLHRRARLPVRRLER